MLLHRKCWFVVHTNNCTYLTTNERCLYHHRCSNGYNHGQQIRWCKSITFFLNKGCFIANMDFSRCKQMPRKKRKQSNHLYRCAAIIEKPLHIVTMMRIDYMEPLPKLSRVDLRRN